MLAGFGLSLCRAGGTRPSPSTVGTYMDATGSHDRIQPSHVLLNPLALRLPILHDFQNGTFVHYTVVFVIDHPLLESEPTRIHSSDPVHVALDQVISVSIPPPSKVLFPRGRAWFSFGRDRFVHVLHFGEPPVDGLAVIHGPLPRHLLERRDEVVPADHLCRNLQIFLASLSAVVKRVPREEAKVLKRDQRDVAVAEGRVEHESPVPPLDWTKHTLQRNA